MDHISAVRKEHLLDQMSQFVSSRSGIVRQTYFYNSQSAALACPMARCFFGGKSGCGTDLSAPTAMIKALAEALERWTLMSSKINGPALYKKSAAELKSLGYPVFFPDEDVYEDSVYKSGSSHYKRMSAELKTDWLAAQRLLDRKTFWLPASLWHYNTPQNKLSNILKSPTSNGMACSFFDSAAEDAILELIERDSFLYMWLAKSPGLEIDFDKIQNRNLKDLLDVIGDKMRQIKVVYKTTDLKTPAVFALFKGKKKYDESAFFITGAADTDIERACYRALLEFVAMYNAYRIYREEYEIAAKKMRSKSPADIQTFHDRTVFYSLFENFHKCEFLFNTRGKASLSSLSKKWGDGEKMKTLKKALERKRVFIADLTPKEMEKTDVRVVRAYSPDLLDLDCGEARRFNSAFKRKRAREIDKLFKRKTNALNSDPHCYP